jgi:hypothetical protein
MEQREDARAAACADSEPDNVFVSTSPPLFGAHAGSFTAIVLGYTAAPRADVQRYANALHRAGAIRVAYSAPNVAQVALDESFTTRVAGLAAAALAPTSSLPVLVLALSDGGCVQYRAMHRVLWGVPVPPALPDLPPPLALLRSRIFGIAFDSAPSPNSALVTGSAVAEVTARGSRVRYAATVVPTTMLAAVQMDVLCGERGRDWPQLRLGRDARLPAVPHLFLIGGVDPFTPASHVDGIVCARRAALDSSESVAPAAPPAVGAAVSATCPAPLAPGSRVTLVTFPHASHLRLLEAEPDRYEAEMAVFVDACFADAAVKERQRPGGKTVGAAAAAAAVATA